MQIIGATNPLAADPGSIRGMYCIDVGRNVIHGRVARLLLFVACIAASVILDFYSCPVPHGP